jgi:hypothetical protein
MANEKTEKLAKEVLRKVCPQGHTREELEILIDAFGEVASMIEDRQASVPRGVGLTGI